MADKIMSIESALNSIRDDLYELTSRQDANDHGDSQDHMKESLSKEEQTYERLLRALEDMKAQIAERVRPVAEQVVHTEVQRLRELSEQHKSTLKECLAQIDQSILGCRTHLDAYREKRADLMSLNERLAKLGAGPVPVPAEIASLNRVDFIRARLDELHSEGKI